jgi:hypothetical protein
MSRINTYVGSPGTIGSASGGKVRAFNNISTTPQQLIGIASERQSITVHNPGTVDIYFAPATVIVAGVEVTLTPSLAALGGCFLIFANGGSLVITGECQKAWQAFAASGTTNALTVMTSNV